MAEQDRDWQGYLDEEPDLHKLVSNNDLEALKLFVQSGADVNLRNRMGATALRTAAKVGALDCLKFLISQGASVDLADIKAQTPLFVAVSNNNTDCVRELLKNGANPDGLPIHLSNPLYIAAMEGNTNIVNLLIEYGATLDTKVIGSFTSTPLYTALVHHHWDCFRALLKAGADPLHTSSQGKVLPLFHSLVKNNAEIENAELLWECGGSVYVVDDKGQYPHELSEVENECKFYVLGLWYKPRQLASFCRLAVRRSLGRQYLKHISSLPLPPKLLSYLKFDVLSFGNVIS